MTVPMNDADQSIFKGESTLTDYDESLFSGNHHKSIVISHNGGACDANLILPFIHELGIKPALIQNEQRLYAWSHTD